MLRTEFMVTLMRNILIFVLFIGANASLFSQHNLALNRAVLHSSVEGYNPGGHLVTDGHSDTRWKSNLTREASLIIDLGEVCRTKKIIIHRPHESEIQVQVSVSQEGTLQQVKNWKPAISETGIRQKTSTLPFSSSTRFVKINFSAESEIYFEVSEIEIQGTKAVQKSKKAENPNSPGVLSGDGWKIMREGYAEGNGQRISELSFDDRKWIPASVPGTVLANYLAAGAIPDPLYADNQLQISESWFTADFWYRKIFVVPEAFQGRKVFLHFKGINWKAEVFVNGQYAGNIKGAFTRAEFDITGLVTPGKTAAVAVLIRKNDNPGEVTEQHLKDPDGNGGIIGLDSPTYVSAIGWNWLPTIRGRNTGITDDVYLSASGPVTISNPQISTQLQLPDTTRAEFSIQVSLKNHDLSPVQGKLRIKSSYFLLEIPVDELKPGETRNLQFNSSNSEQLMVQHPKLWWPNGYGKQELDDMAFSFISGAKTSDSLIVRYGIRQYDYHYKNGNLFIWCNGYPVLIRGGNWGLPEALLRNTPAQYDLWVRLHKDMNLNMIRNWVGQTAHDAFYEACDRHGIMVFDDFWLANPVDGPHPSDEKMFLKNAEDKILRFRNHASVALWAGRNEGYPPASLDSALRDMTGTLDPEKHYISNSCRHPVTGLGPYEIKNPDWYFRNRGETFHTEQGIVAVPVVESMRAMMPEENLWPVNDMWGKHDWTQPRVDIYTNDLERSYGKPTSIEEFCKKAWLMNTEGPKAMMETWQYHRGPGVLVWMTHPAWPSMICQTYDYYLEPTSAYFAIKKGSEPVHIFRNPLDGGIYVANNTLKNITAASVEVIILNEKGETVFSKTLVTEIPALQTQLCVSPEMSDNRSELLFISLKLKNIDDVVLSENFYYVNPVETGNYTALNRLPEITLSAECRSVLSGDKMAVEIKISNPTQFPAIMIRLKAENAADGSRILPAFWSDNYFSLMPGESRIITITPEEWPSSEIKVTAEGYNCPEQTVIWRK
ncbi:MAG: hypothetical protein FD170_2455 [Bacteroidetes bacterium]|nr:MAG: hypothetical protein FD170_2455 [Bacteroidota bacterium]